MTSPPPLSLGFAADLESSPFMVTEGWRRTQIHLFRGHRTFFASFRVSQVHSLIFHFSGRPLRNGARSIARSFAG